MKESKNLEAIRHSFAHLLAAAVKELYPNAKPTLGPAIENGFYYDFDFASPISEADLGAIEGKMKAILKSWQSKNADWFKGKTVSAKKAKDAFKGNEYKKELIEEIKSRKEKITLYKTGDFIDLCRGGHANKPFDLKENAFKLTSLAGAYWRGDEKNTMLTRIYGVAFENKKDLDAHLAMLEEAKARDHRKLGAELDLFVSSEIVGAGLPLFTPKGTILRSELEGYTKALRQKAGFEYVWTPHIAKDELYKKSGHWDKFEDDIFHVQSKKTDIGFIIKPMNCPHHIQIFANTPKSYKDLPIRYADTSTVYRDENTGQLQGLTRVRSITQDDSHVFCRKDQIKSEAKISQGIIKELYKNLAIEIKPTLSTHDPSQMKKYLGDKKLWAWAEKELRSLLAENGKKAEEIKGEAAFYGPKIDYIGTDSIGRKHQLATIQLDFNQPKRFNLEYINEKGKKEDVFMLHVAVLGSTERFIGILIEHFAGKFPLWLSPVQARILAVSDKFQKYGRQVLDELKEAGIRAELAEANESLGKRIRQAKNDRIPYILVVGENEQSAGTVSPENFRDGKLKEMKVTLLIKKLQKEIKEKKI